MWLHLIDILLSAKTKLCVNSFKSSRALPRFFLCRWPGTLYFIILDFSLNPPLLAPKMQENGGGGCQRVLEPPYSRKTIKDQDAVVASQ